MTDIQVFDFSVNLLRAILWQYNDAVRLQSLLRQKQDWYQQNQSDFWGNWYNDVFNLQTADDFGLSVWGVILGESRDVALKATTVDYPAFGFSAQHKNFGRGNFRRSHADFTRLTTEQYRLFLRLKYYRLVSRGTVPEINAYAAKLLPEQRSAYVIDPLDMSYAVYVFSRAPTSLEMFVLKDMDALPRPAGVGVKIRVL